MTNFCNFPPETSNTKKRRRINQVKNKFKKGTQNKVINRQGNQEAGGRNQGSKRKHHDVWEVLGTDGSKIEVHPSYSFSSEVWNKIPFPVRTQLMDMRKEYKKTRTQKQVHIQAEENKEVKPSSGGTIMGGRNEQASLRSRNTNSRS